MIKIKVGNILNSKCQTLVNTVNCVGVMGKGIAKEFKNEYPEMFKQYKKQCELNKIKTGKLYIYQDLNNKKIINFPTKKHWRNSADLEGITKGLDKFVKNYKKWGIKSVAFPPLGCGNGGLDWRYVGSLMYNKLKGLDIDVELYAPYGTKPEYLKKEYLSKNSNIKDIKNKMIKVKPEWIVLLNVVEKLNEKKYTKAVGRVIFQKIFFLGEQASVANFNFKRGTYGPYSNETKKALWSLANNNVINEEKKGRMFELQLGSNYYDFKDKYKEVILENEEKIERITDLFQRIKNTEQAEEVATVLWVERELKQKKNNQIVEDTEVINRIIDWKQQWNESEKLKNIYQAILILNMLKWTNIKIKDDRIKEYINKAI